MKTTIGNLRIETELLENMKKALEEFNLNKSNQISIPSLKEFRRFAYEVFSQMILQNKTIPVKFN